MTRPVPTDERPGLRGSLGPVSLVLAILGWLVPFGEVLSVLALGAGALALWLGRRLRLDGFAVAGCCIASAQLFFALLLWTMELSGH
ncbi:hypothetical protein [Prauserella cavernicola]|uniref:Uncharacterized protein n=1 Tax=Prauserella cavernicola TaxID=2800127 RepID=A0A934QP50_9PSEU|nr:hypothetical protein [Prauserella cavernicola]MBK1783810.1 hypothetical protein [Prauserella cavernicola]